VNPIETCCVCHKDSEGHPYWKVTLISGFGDVMYENFVCSAACLRNVSAAIWRRLRDVESA